MKAAAPGMIPVRQSFYLLIFTGPGAPALIRPAARTYSLSLQSAISRSIASGPGAPSVFRFAMQVFIEIAS